MNVRPQSRQGAAPEMKTKVVMDFSGGVNFSTAREAIEDNELWWCEGAMPVARGNLTITNGPGLGITLGGWAAESGAPSYAKTFNVAGTDYVFLVWKNSGNGWIGPVAGALTQYFFGTLTSGATSADQWNNQGLLIVDSTGYWDWNITAAATLTALNNSVQSVTINDGGTGYTSSPGATFGGPGAGASATVFIGLGAATIFAAGTGYIVSDVLTIPYSFGGGGELMTVTVTTVNATGGVTGVKVNTVGKGITISGAAIASIGGAGTGAQFTVAGAVTQIRVDVRGSGYSSAPGVTLAPVGATRAATATANVSGSLAGQAIAVYAGRAWIGSNRTITFTDAGSYQSFIGSGSQFTINDPWLHNKVNALFTANNYLYIFGDDSIDVLSNVTITAAGTAQFSRVNVTASVGTNLQTSIFSYYRSICFANGSGFWMLSGATPELMSAKLANFIPRTDPTSIYGGQVTVQNELCAAFLVSFTDVWFNNGATMTILVIYYKGKWFFARQARSNTVLSLKAMISVPASVGAGFSLYGYSTEPKQYKLMSDSGPTQVYWRVITKLYSVTPPMIGVQAMRAGMGCQMGGATSSRAGLAFTVDQESDGTTLFTYVPGQATSFEAGNFAGYKMFQGTSNEAGGKYVGWGLAGITSSIPDVVQIEWLALDYTESNPW